jgi:predicted transposase YbfD/YdcC
VKKNQEGHMAERLTISIIEHFGDMPDPRQQAKVLYPLSEIILLTLCAIICGADSYVEIEEFGNAKIDFLRRFLYFKHGIPSHDTIGIVFSNIDSKIFNRTFIEWTRAVQKSIPEFVAIDGKTVRRSRDGKKHPIHLVSAWANQQGLVLGQTKTNEKSNEITAIPELLSMLELRGAIVTIDAAGCQKKIVKNIISKKADYVIAVKNNQPTLYQEIELFFRGVDSQTLPLTLPTCRTFDKDHGRIETRKYSITDQIDFLTATEQWEGIKSIGSVTSIREIDGVSTENTRYFISSLPADEYLFAKAVRSHWGIENSLHWVMDVVFRDDECRIRKKHGPANFGMMKHITHNLLKSLPGKKSMRVRRQRAGWDDEFLASALVAELV